MTVSLLTPEPIAGVDAVASQRLALLWKASEIMASSRDFEATLRQVAWLPVPEFADWCAVLQLDLDNSIGGLTVAYPSPAQADIASAFERNFLKVQPKPGGMLEQVAAGRSVLLPRLGEEEFNWLASNSRTQKLLRATGMRSLIAVPLKGRDRHVGLLAFVTSESGHTYSDDDLAFAEKLARRCAVAVENARLYREIQGALHEKEQSLERERAARDQAETAQRQLALLAGASELLASSLDYDATLNKIAWLAVPDLADWCAVYLMESDETLRLKTLAYANPAHAALAHVMEQAPPLLSEQTSNVFRSGWPQLESIEVQSRMHLPLRARGRTLGLMVLLATSDSGRRYGPTEVWLAQQLADRCAVALDNAMLVGELRRALGVREELLAATSHELRTPLAHIKGFTSSLRQPDVEWDEATRQDFLAEIEREADRLADLIGDLLNMSRLESGAPEQHARVQVAPSALVEAGMDRVRGLLNCGQVAVDVESNLPSVLVDAPHLELVVANLLENAVKYGAHARIAVIARRVDGELELAVEDDGPGIPEEDLERVFDKFYRAMSTEQSGVPGTGLGLAICRAIVQNHGGRIWAENKPSGGARLAVRLPLESED